MIGLTDEVLSTIEERQKKKERGQTSTALYQAASTMKEYRLSPSQWRRLSNLDKKILIYARVMEQHYLDCVYEDQERKRDQEKRQKEMMANMPKQVLPKRR